MEENHSSKRNRAEKLNLDSKRIIENQALQDYNELITIKQVFTDSEIIEEEKESFSVEKLLSTEIGFDFKNEETEKMKIEGTEEENKKARLIKSLSLDRENYRSKILSSKNNLITLKSTV